MAPSCGCPDFGGTDESGSWYDSSVKIERQPSDASEYDGSKVLFSVKASGVGPLAYQWQYCATEDGDYADVSGGSSRVLEIASMSATIVGFYRCVVSNPSGKSATSRSASLTRLIHVPPQITRQPIGGTYLSGTARSLSVVATGTPIVSYQWYFSGDSGETWVALSGESTAAIYQTTVTADTVGLYRCIVSDRYGDATSDSAELILGYMPTIVADPQSGNYTSGDSVTLTVSASGTAPLSYQWYRGSSPISGGTAAEYVFTASLDNCGAYHCVVTNEFGSATSSSASVFIAPVITSQPNWGAVTLGGTASTSVEAVGPGTFTYLWYKDGTALPTPEYASSVITISDVERSDSGRYTCVVTSEYGSVESDPSDLLVDYYISIRENVNTASEFYFSDAADGVIQTPTTESVDTVPALYFSDLDDSVVNAPATESLTMGATLYFLDIEDAT